MAPRPQSSHAEFGERKAALKEHVLAHGVGRSAKKATASNTYRYEDKTARPVGQIPLACFDHVLGFAPGGAEAGGVRLVDVEGLTTMESLVAFAQNHGLFPGITPELRHITVGGAIVGIGIESGCFRHGFFHDMAVELEVLTGTGEIVVCSAKNEHAALFNAMPNSYGTLGYVLRARLRLHPSKPFVEVRNIAYPSVSSMHKAMLEACEQGADDFVEGLIFSQDQCVLTLSRYVDKLPSEKKKADTFVGMRVYWLAVRDLETIYLTPTEYLFRWDSDFFWNIPTREESLLFHWLRAFVPAKYRTSVFYRQFSYEDTLLHQVIGLVHPINVEPLIQDWEVPAGKDGDAFCDWCVKTYPLPKGRPYLMVPIKAHRDVSLYPAHPGRWLLNLGCYYSIENNALGSSTWEITAEIDKKCYDIGGTKMLYSSTFLERDEFYKKYGGAENYAALKARYDPTGSFKGLWEKTCAATTQSKTGNDQHDHHQGRTFKLALGCVALGAAAGATAWWFSKK